MKKIVLTEDIVSSINFFFKIAEMYFGASNSANTYLPHLEKILKAQIDDIDMPIQQEACVKNS